MLTLEESVEIHDKVRLFEGEAPYFTDEQMDKAEDFDIRLNPVTFGVDVTLYGAGEQSLGTVSFEDADIAIVFIEELFELDPEDLEWLESYAWANAAADSIETEEQESEFLTQATLDATVLNID